MTERRFLTLSVGSSPINARVVLVTEEKALLDLFIYTLGSILGVSMREVTSDSVASRKDDADPPSGPLVYSERDLDKAGVLSRKTRYLLRKRGEFPQPRKVGNRSLYDGTEIRAWLKNNGS